MNEKKAILTIKEFCEDIGISRSTFQKLKRNKQSPKIISVAGIQRISQASVNEWIAQNQT
jgi:excisionase family DNA binding protein